MVSLPAGICPIYKEAAENLFRIVDSPTASHRKKLKVIEKFCGKFLMFSQLLEYNKNIDERNRIYYEEMEDKINVVFCERPNPSKDCNEKHIYWNGKIPLTNFHKEILPSFQIYCQNIKDSEALLKFPHENLKKVWEACDDYGVQPMSMSEQAKKDYEKSLKLYQKFVAAGDDNEKWTECIGELDNYDAIVANIELRLGENQQWANQKLWKLYIEFFKKHQNPKSLILVLRQYCRLFVSDVEARKDYCFAIAALMATRENCFAYWTDLAKIYGDFESPDVANQSLSEIMIALLGQSFYDGFPFEERLQCFESNLRGFELALYRMKNNAVQEDEISSISISHPNLTFPTCSPISPIIFPLPYFIKTYMFENMSAKLIQKLHKCSKYFFIKLPHPICHRLVLDPDTDAQYMKQSIFIKNVNQIPDQSLHISTNLTVTSSNQDPPWIHINKNLLSQLLPKIYKCEARILVIFHQNFTVKEFKVLIESGNVKKLIMKNCKIFHDKDMVLDLEDRVALTKEEIEAMMEASKNINFEIEFPRFFNF